MSGIQIHKGKLVLVQKRENELLEDRCKRICRAMMIGIEGYDDYTSALQSIGEYIVVGDDLYRVHDKDIDVYDRETVLNKNNDGSYSYFTHFYDGGTNLTETLEEEMEREKRKMLLRDILDMPDYLQNRCYCPGEIYELNGFFYDVYSGEEECYKIGENEDVIAVICGNQILYIYKSDEKNTVKDITRVDATKNNITIIKQIIAHKKPKGKLDRFKDNNTEQALEHLMSMADAIIVD